MKKQIHTHISLLRFLLLLVMVGGSINAFGQETRHWDFTNWSAETVANLKADAAASKVSGWSDVEKQADAENDAEPTEASKDNCFWATKGITPNADGELLAKGEVIKELKGLKFTNSEYLDKRNLAIAVNYPKAVVQTTETYVGGSYLWLGGGPIECFTIPAVKGGSIIKMGIESHAPTHKDTPARGVELYIGSKKIDGPIVPTTYEVQTWIVPNEGETVDVIVKNTNGCHIYFIEISQDMPEEIVVGQSQVWFRNNELANRIGDLGNGDFTYTSSNPNIVTFETGTNTGIATIKGIGTAIVTVTKNGALQGSYSVRVKKDTWDFSSIPTGISKDFTDYSSWNEVSATEELYFKGSWTTGANSGKNAVKTTTGTELIKVPALAGQLVEIMASKKASGGTNNHNLTEEGLEDKGPSDKINSNHFRISGTNAIITFTAKVSNERTDFVVGVNDVTNGKDDYFHSIKTYFPSNEISFANSGEYTVSYLPNSPQPGQLAVTNNSTNNVYYESLDPSVATVHPLTGEVTTKQANTTVKIRAYNLGEIGKYNGDKTTFADYTLKIESQEKLITNINIEDLLYKDLVTAANEALNRTIPYFNIIVDGGTSGQAAQSNGTDGLRLKYEDGVMGKLIIQPRYITRSENIAISSVTVTFVEPPLAGEILNVNGQPYTLTGDLTQTFSGFRSPSSEIEIEYGSNGDGVVISNIHIYGEADGGIAVSGILSHEKDTPTIKYDIESGTYKIPVDSKIPLDALASSCNYRFIAYDLSENEDGAFSLKDGYIYANKAGTTKLKGIFYGSSYFAPSESTWWTLTAVGDTHQAEFDISNKIKVEKTPSIDGFAFNNVKLEPVVSINGVDKNDYSVVYTTDNTRLAYVNAEGSLMTYPKTEGLVTITATITPKNSSTIPILTATFDLMVLSGEWNFAEIGEVKKESDGMEQKTHFRNLKTKSYKGADGSGDAFHRDNYESPYDSDKDAWYFNPDPATKGNNAVMSRNTNDFEYILYSGRYKKELENEPIDIAQTLQTKNSVRWFRVDGKDDNGELQSYFHLFGRNKNDDTGEYTKGGILKVPAQVGMVIDIWAASDSENAEMLINTDGDPSHADKTYSAVEKFDGTSVTYFYLETPYDHYRYIVTNTDQDGFIYIVNCSDNLYFYIKSIKLTTEIAFENGTDVYVDGEKGGTVKNRIQNAGTNDSFIYTGVGVAPDNEGNVTVIEGQYGSFTVNVEGTGNGILDGIKGAYTIHSIYMKAQNPEPYTASDDLSWTADDLKKFITKISYGPDGADLDASVKNKVVFSEISRTESIRKVTFKGETGSQTLAIEGIGTVKIQAKLGSLVREITIDIAGVALSDRSPVCSNTDSSVSFWINTSAEELVNYTEEQIKEDRKWMLDNLLGDIRNYRNEGKADELQLAYDPATRTFTLSRADGSPFTHGGTMPIRVTYNNRSTLVGMLTIAYSKHNWNFESNMLLYDHPTFKGVYKFYTDNTKDTEVEKRLGVWSANATFDQPEHKGTSSPDNDWCFVRKMGVNHPGSKIIYYYNHSVDGDNAMILPETAGLLINSAKNSDQFGVLMEDEVDTSKNKENGEQPTKGKLFDININGEYTKVSGRQGYSLKNVMLKLGGELVVPYVKPGQWIEMRWWRHVAGRGERMTLTNLSDVQGKYIDDTYKIGNTQQGTYMFQVKKQPERVVDENTDHGEYVDAVFHIIDNVYIEIQEVILHEPGWEYESSMTKELKGTGDIDRQYITSEQCIIALGNHVQHNAPNAPCDWQVRWFGKFSDDIVNKEPALDNDGKKRPYPYLSESNTNITVKEGEWGKVYATLTSYTSDYKYVANRKTWTITFGKSPAQTYPYTWDFTKYFKGTKTGIGGDDDDYFEEDDKYDATANPTGSHEFRIDINTWNESGNEETVVTTDYDTEHYGSFFVEGAQLVSYGQPKDNGGEEKYDGIILPETAGLGFKLPNLGDMNNDNVGILKLDMQSVNEFDDMLGADNDMLTKYKVQNGETWRSGKLAIRGGGTIIVPRPEQKAEDFRIYVKSSVQPETNATSLSDDVDGQKGQYRYSFPSDGDVELKFNGDADIYAIAVTNVFKDMTLLSGTGWATESREMTIDHALTGYLTTNPTQAYAVVETDTDDNPNPLYSDNKTQTVVALRDRRYVVPKEYGLVMKQEENVPKVKDEATQKVKTYQVPLFVPAVTTAEDEIDEGEFNLMRPNVKETKLEDETEKVLDPNAMGTEYTRFILASRYMTWKSEDGKVTGPDKYHEGEVAAFYRLYLVGDDEEIEGKGKDPNTLPAHTAYLLLLTNKLRDALWDSKTSTENSARPFYVGIEGVSDMFDDPNIVEPSPVEADGVYNLNGQKLNPNSRLTPGIYIKNGKKIYVDRQNVQ